MGTRVPFRGALTGPVKVTGERIGIIVPSGWASAGLSFLASEDGVTWSSVYDDSGTEVAATVDASRAVALSSMRNALSPFQLIRIRSGTASSPIAQGVSAASRVYTPEEGKTLTITSGIKGSIGNELSFSFGTAEDDTLAASVSGATVTINLANTTAASNAAAEIQSLLRGLTVSDIDVTSITVSGDVAYEASPPIAADLDAAPLLGGVDLFVEVCFRDVE